MTRAVTLPGGRRISLGAYIGGWRAVRAAPPGKLFAGWSEEATSAGSILAAIRAGIDDRINRHLPWRGVKKMSADYQRGLAHDAHQLNTPRLLVHYLNTPALRERFRSRLEDAAEAHGRVLVLPAPRRRSGQAPKRRAA